MHVLIAGLYAVIIWLALLAYVVIVKGPMIKFLVLSPFVISGSIAAIITLDLVVRGVCWMWQRWRPVRVN